MAALLFPPTPSDGDTYEGYIFNAAKNVWQWQALIPSVESLSDTVITTPTLGDGLVYDGTNWVNDEAGGGLVAVKSAIFAGVQSASVTAGGNLAITDLSISHEVSDPANKLIITATIGALASSAQQGQAGLAVFDGTNFIAVGDAAGSRSRISAGGLTTAGTTTRATNPLSTTFVHTPGSGSKTYTVRAVNTRGDTRTLFVNRDENDSDSADSPRAVSTLVIMEVAV